MMEQVKAKDIDPQVWEQTQGTWSEFVKLGKWSIVSILILLALMAIFLV